MTGVRGAQFDVTIRNTSAVPVNGWTLTWSLPGSQRITQSWNATVTQSGAAATAVNVAWNGRSRPPVRPASDSSPTARSSGATGFALNGTACTATA